MITRTVDSGRNLNAYGRADGNSILGFASIGMLCRRMTVVYKQIWVSLTCFRLGVLGLRSRLWLARENSFAICFLLQIAGILQYRRTARAPCTPWRHFRRPSAKYVWAAALSELKTLISSPSPSGTMIGSSRFGNPVAIFSSHFPARLEIAVEDTTPRKTPQRTMIRNMQSGTLILSRVSRSEGLSKHKVHGDP